MTEYDVPNGRQDRLGSKTRGESPKTRIAAPVAWLPPAAGVLLLVCFGVARLAHATWVGGTPIDVKIKLPDMSTVLSFSGPDSSTSDGDYTISKMFIAQGDGGTFEVTLAEDTDYCVVDGIEVDSDDDTVTCTWSGDGQASGNSTVVDTSTPACHSISLEVKDANSPADDDGYNITIPVDIVGVGTVVPTKSGIDIGGTTNITTYPFPFGSTYPSGKVTWRRRHKTASGDAWGSWTYMPSATGCSTCTLTGSSIGYYEVEAKCGTSKYSTVVVVSGVKSLSCDGVVSTTDTPGDAETVVVSKGAAGSSVTITAAMEPTDSERPTSRPVWSGVSGTAGSLTANVPTDAIGNFTVIADCGTSSVAIRVIVAEVIVTRVLPVGRAHTFDVDTEGMRFQAVLSAPAGITPNSMFYTWTLTGDCYTDPTTDPYVCPHEPDPHSVSTTWPSANELLLVPPSPCQHLGPRNITCTMKVCGRDISGSIEHEVVPLIQVTDVSIDSPATSDAWPYDPVWDDIELHFPTHKGWSAQQCADDSDAAFVHYTLNTAEATQVDISIFRSVPLATDVLVEELGDSTSPNPTMLGANWAKWWINDETLGNYYARVRAETARAPGNDVSVVDSAKVEILRKHYYTKDRQYYGLSIRPDVLVTDGGSAWDEHVEALMWSWASNQAASWIVAAYSGWPITVATAVGYAAWVVSDQVGFQHSEGELEQWDQLWYFNVATTGHFWDTTSTSGYLVGLAPVTGCLVINDGEPEWNWTTMTYNYRPDYSATFIRPKEDDGEISLIQELWPTLSYVTTPAATFGGEPVNAVYDASTALGVAQRCRGLLLQYKVDKPAITSFIWKTYP